MISEGSTQTRTGTFAYLEAGPADGPLALVLHGFPDVPRSFEQVLEALAAAGYHAVAPWMRGYAPSPLQGPYDPDTTGSDVVALADALSPERPAVLVGHDWGAVAGYSAAAECPARFRCFVALSVPHPLSFLLNLGRNPGQLVRSAYMVALASPVLGERLVRARDFRFVDLAWGHWTPGHAPPPALIAEIKETLARSLPGPIRYYRAVLWPPLVSFPRSTDVRRRIKVPTLQVAGTRDLIKPELGDGQAQYFQGEFRRELIDAGHFMQVERPEAVIPLILGWAQRHAPQPG